MVSAKQAGEEGARIEIVEFGLALLHRLERLDAFVRIEPVEIAVVGLARPGVGGGDAGGDEFGRRQRQLIALLRLAFEIGPARYILAPPPQALASWRSI